MDERVYVGQVLTGYYISTYRSFHNENESIQIEVCDVML